jgi:hypothetical protein
MKCLARILNHHKLARPVEYVEKNDNRCLEKMR